MSGTAWGSVTAKASGGASDPNVLTLGESQRVRLLEPGARKWRQHGIEGRDEQFRSVNCPKGPDGRINTPCPLCMKPVGADGKQLFSISKRYATNVWDYESNSVKVLIAGKQIFDEFDAYAQVGQDPMTQDWIIFKQGSGISTSYKVVPVPPTGNPQVSPEDLHDLDKYEMPDSVEKIFEKLESAGIDYDAIELPSYTFEEAEQFQMPYGKAKGQTLEQLYANDRDYLHYMHGVKLEGGQMGDPVFLAMHALLEHYGEVEAIDGMPATTAPKPASNGGATPPSTGAGEITLLDPSGNAVSVPASAKAALLGAGYSEPKDEPTESGIKTLIGPDGKPVDVPQGAVDVMLANGFTDPTAPPDDTREPETMAEITFPVLMAPPTGGEPMEAPNEDVYNALLSAGYQVHTPVPAGEDEHPIPQPARDDDGNYILDMNGTRVSIPESGLASLLAAGATHVYEGSGFEERDAAQAEQQPSRAPRPAQDEPVQFKLNVVPTPIPQPWKDAVTLWSSNQGDFVGDNAEDYRYYAAQEMDGAVPAAADGAADPNSPGGASPGVDLDPSLTTKGDDGKWYHPAIEGGTKGYAAKGGVTQALNRLAKQQPQESVAQPPNPATAVAAASGKDALLASAREKLKLLPDLAGDFDKLLGIFERVANKRNIADFTEDELVKLNAELDAYDGNK